MTCPPRTRFQGVRQVLTFNWPAYSIAGVVLIFGIVVCATRTGSGALQIAAASIVIGFAYFSLMSLAVSHWVYDRAGIYSFQWMPPFVASREARWINVHAGLDDTTCALEDRMSTPPVAVLDIFRPDILTERSIARARSRRDFDSRSKPADPEYLPLDDACCNVAFVAFTAHEIRTRELRAAFFRELRRVIAPDGNIVLVEHLRDSPNFFAFGPGILHFFSHRTWLQTFSAAGLRVRVRIHLTPFVSAFVLSSTPIAVDAIHHEPTTQ